MTLTGAYRITEIDGAPALGDFELVLDPEGRVYGRVVNRFSGAVELGEDSLVLGAIMATRMAGPPELMSQEDAVFRVLVGTATVAEDGKGLLLSSDGGALGLVRVVPDDGIDDSSLV